MGLGSDIQLSDRLPFEWDDNTDHEYRLELDSEVNKMVSFIGSHDDKYGRGLIIRAVF